MTSSPPSSRSSKATHRRWSRAEAGSSPVRRSPTRFRSAGFAGPEFYVVGAEDLPFEEASFDLCLCILSLNFFEDCRRALREAHRVLAPGSPFVCCVPVPERNPQGRTIRGRLYSGNELSCMLHELGFRY